MLINIILAAHFTSWFSFLQNHQCRWIIQGRSPTLSLFSLSKLEYQHSNSHKKMISSIILTHENTFLLAAKIKYRIWNGTLWKCKESRCCCLLLWWKDAKMEIKEALNCLIFCSLMGNFWRWKRKITNIRVWMFYWYFYLSRFTGFAICVLPTPVLLCQLADLKSLALKHFQTIFLCLLFHSALWIILQYVCDS